MTQCALDGCEKPVKARGLCDRHYLRVRRYGRLHRVQARKGEGTRTTNGYRRVGRQYEHRLMIESLIGIKLPDGAEIHHVDGDKMNNAPANLVICQDRSYHALLHQRQRALDACGRADWRKCPYCKEWDDPKNMIKRSGRGSVHHSACAVKYNRNRPTSRA